VSVHIQEQIVYCCVQSSGPLIRSDKWKWAVVGVLAISPVGKQS